MAKRVQNKNINTIPPAKHIQNNLFNNTNNDSTNNDSTNNNSTNNNTSSVELIVVVVVFVKFLILAQCTDSKLLGTSVTFNTLIEFVAVIYEYTSIGTKNWVMTQSLKNLSYPTHQEVRDKRHHHFCNVFKYVFVGISLIAVK